MSEEEQNSTQQELLELEAQAWKALSAGQGADHYGQMMIDPALVVVPGNVLTREEALKSFGDVPPWSDYQLGGGEFLQLSDLCALITYRARAKRDQDATAYSARFTSVYVKVEDEWKLAFHQQTPDPQVTPLPAAD